MPIVSTIKKSIVHDYANFKGRSSRREYILFFAFYLGLLLIAQTTQILVSEISYAVYANKAEPFTGALAMLGGIDNILRLFVWVLILALVIPSLSITVRRLHDINYSGWWYLLVVVPVVGFLVYLVLLFWRGTKGANRFGQDPLQFT